MDSQTVHLKVNQLTVLGEGQLGRAELMGGVMVCVYEANGALGGAVLLSATEKWTAKRILQRLVEAVQGEKKASLADPMVKFAGPYALASAFYQASFELSLQVSGRYYSDSKSLSAYFYPRTGRLRVGQAENSDLALGPSPSLIAIGASTGGTNAIRFLLSQFPAEIPPVLISQHILADYSRIFVSTLQVPSGLRLKEAEQNDRLEKGCIYVVPGSQPMNLERIDKGHYINLETAASGARPIDCLFQSVAEHFGKTAVGVLLTGMGSDGAAGLLEMHRRGATTLAQDESTSVVFGMPRQAMQLGAVDFVLTLEKISKKLNELCLAASVPEKKRAG